MQAAVTSPANPRDRRSILVSVDAKKLKEVHYDQIQRQTVALLSEFPEDELGTVERFFAWLNAISIDRGPLEPG